MTQKVWHGSSSITGLVSAIPNPHDKSPILVTESGQLLLPMYERTFCVLKCASQDCILPDPDAFAFDKVYWPCCLVSKKRYVGYSYSSRDQKAPSFDAKGIETVRRDSCRWTQENMKKVLEIMFSGVQEHLWGKMEGISLDKEGDQEMERNNKKQQQLQKDHQDYLAESSHDKFYDEPVSWKRKKLKLQQRNVKLAKQFFQEQALRIRNNEVSKSDLLFYKEYQVQKCLGLEECKFVMLVSHDS